MTEITPGMFDPEQEKTPQEEVGSVQPGMFDPSEQQAQQGNVAQDPAFKGAAIQLATPNWLKQTAVGLQDAMTAFARPFSRKLEGLIQLTTGNKSEQLQERIKEQEALMKEAKERSPFASIMGQVPGEVLSAMAAFSAGGKALSAAGKAIQAGKAGKAATAALGASKAASEAHPLAAGAAKLAGQSAALAGLDPAESAEERLKKMGTAAGAGALLKFAGAAGTKYGKPILGSLAPDTGVTTLSQRMKDPKLAAKIELAENIKAQSAGKDPFKLMKQAAEDTKVLGMKPLTPGQVFGGPRVGGKEKLMIVDAKIKNLMTKDMMKNMNKIDKYMNKLLDDMSPKTMKTQLRLGNKYLESASVDKEVVNKIRQDSVTGQLLDEFNKMKYSKVAKMPNQSLKKLNSFRDHIDKKIWADNTVLDTTKKMDKTQLDGLKDARTKVTELLAKADKNYLPLMKMKQRFVLQKRWQEKLTKAEDTSIKVTGDSAKTFHRALFKSDLNKDQFLKDIKTVGGDVKKTQSIMNQIDRLKDDPIARVILRPMPQQADTVAVYGRDVGILQRYFNKITIDKFNDALLKLTLSGNKWQGDVMRVLKHPPKMRSSKFLGLIKRVIEKSKHTYAPITAEKVGDIVEDQ